MKIRLEFPYNADWRYGYIVINPEGRKTVILYNNNKNRSSVSYARYLLSVHLNRYLSKDEHVDHIDNDKTNDTLSNLQILTPIENNRKSSNGRAYKEMICDFCGKEFKREKRLLYAKRKTCCCSRKCSSKLQWQLKT